MSIFLHWQTLVAALGSYLLGCSNGAILVSKYILHDDIRSHGSGNAGLTNFYRTFGGGLTFLVIFSDVLKAVLAVLLGAALFAPLQDPTAGKFAAGLFVLLGHMFPVMFRFRGGKGILSGGAIVVMMDWRIAVFALGAFLLLTLITRWVSLGSIAAAVTFVIATRQVYRTDAYTVIAVIIAVLIIWKHRGNIRRLLRGEEPKFTLHKKETNT